MGNRLGQEFLARSCLGNIESARRVVGASRARERQETWCQEQEREWENRLSDMQKCICDLLYENQRLRECVISTANHRSEELADEHSPNLTRNRS